MIRMPSYIEMPKLSDTMTEGTVVKWRKVLGDTVETGDVVAEIETDKAVMELEAFAEGTLNEIYVHEGGKARIGQKLASVGVAGEPEGSAPSSGRTEQPVSRPISCQPPVSVPEPHLEPTNVSSSSLARVKASPLARKLATESGVDLGLLKGSGPGGRIVARDVGAATAAKQPPASGSSVSAIPHAPAAAQPNVSGSDRRIPLSGMRKVIADRLLASKTQIPHFYLHIEVDAGEMVHLRTQVNAAMEKAAMGKLTINDFILKAAVMAAVRVPRVNAAFAGDAIIEYANVHLAVAVAVDEGLVTPVIREAERKSLREISEAVKDLANRARTKRLKPDEYQGGTLTVSNLGSYGIESFSAIVNPPQSVILSIGAIVRKPVVNAAGQITVGERMTVGLSADHRVVDGAVAAQYLAQLRQLLENPTLLLL
jgi:pyruvate dehydrogenase E2 component (dihydrolipoamide acetyltransferase)